MTQDLKYDLEERTAKFSRDAIALCRKIREDVISRPLVSQLIRSATSIGANYVEANAASSKKDFANKIFICKKEAHETRYWLGLVVSAIPNTEDGVRGLQKECQELILIFQKITSTLRN